MAALWAVGLPGTYPSPRLLLTLNFVFSTLASLFIAYLIARSFLVRGTAGLLMLGCGVLAWGAAGVVSAVAGLVGAQGRDFVNINVTVFNLCAWLAALCHLAGAFLSMRPRQAIQAAGLSLAAAYAAILGVVGLVTMAACGGWTPVFFIQGQGGTLLRQVVLGSAIAMIGSTAIVLLARNRKSFSLFTYWYALALALIATGLLGVWPLSSFDAALNWNGRAALYLGGSYMLIAALASVRENQVWGIPLGIALEEAQQQYELLFQASSDGIVMHELVGEPGSGKFLQANDAICHLLGYPAEEMRDLTPLDIIVPEEAHAIAGDRQTMQTQGVLVHEKLLLAKDGRRIPTEISSRLLEHHGQPMVISIIRDITERKRAEEALRTSEERFRLFMDTSPTIAWVKDDQGRYVYMDKTYQDRFGLPLEEYRGKNDAELWAPEIAAEFLHNDLIVKAAGHPLEFTERTFNPDGSPTWWLNTKFPFRDAAGNQFVAGIGLDITARKRAEEERESAKALLELANQATTPHELARQAIVFFQRISGCAAVGLRLREGDDYPYYEHCGLTGEFLCRENSLWDRDPAGNVQLDDSGMPFISCMCGNVICRRTNPARPFFTPGGSFWTNSTTRFLASTTEADRLTKTRNVCNQVGFESLALIPLRAGEQTLGLLHLADAQAGRFSAEALSHYERLAGQLAVALAKLQAEKALRESRQRLEWVLMNTGVGTWFNTMPLDQLNWDEQTRRLFFVPPGAEPTIELFWSRIHPDDREPTRLAVENAIRKRTLYEIDHRAVNPETGEVRWIRSVGQATYGADETPIRFDGINFDITERKRAEEALRASEERLRLAQEAGKIGIWEWDLETGETFMTPECYLLWGVPPQPGPNRLDWFELIHPEDRERSRRDTEAFLCAGGDWRNEFRVIHPDGQVHWLLSQGQSTQMKNGHVVRAHGCIMDITGQKQAEEQLRAANSSLAESDRRKDEFLAILAHELRNPLAPVRYAIQILRMAEVPEEARRRQEAIIERQVTHMARLLDDLLDVSRVTRGKVDLRPEPLCLTDVLVHAADTARPGCESRRQQLHFAPPARDLWVEADVDRLTQAVGNLLINASKFTGDGGQIWLEADREGDEAVIRVRDTGIGITAELLPRVFELFVQADDPRHRSQGGLGIGLTLVLRLIEMHGGTVEARSEGEGLGSEFIIRLPLLPMAQAKEPAFQIPVGQTLKQSSRRILVVDDIVDSATSLTEMLGLWGHETRAVHDGFTAIETVRDWRPEIVLLDIGMPGIDGYETARRLREEHQRNGLRLVALTGFGQEADREAAREAGFDAHLVKPVEITALTDMLARLSD